MNKRPTIYAWIAILFLVAAAVYAADEIVSRTINYQNSTLTFDANTVIKDADGNWTINWSQFQFLSTNTGGGGGSITGIVTVAQGGTGATNATAAVYNLGLRPTEYDNGNSGTSKAIDWANGVRQKVTLTGNCTFTLTGAPTNTSVLQLKVIQDTTGSRTITVTGAKWANATVPVPTSSTGAVDIVTFYYDGTSYYGTMTKNFQ